ncbi:hypothetical protein COOONC_24494, partial [Cooperia oncophora]
MRMRRSLQLRWVGELLHKEVKDKLAAGITLHDENLRYMAIDFREEIELEAAQFVSVVRREMASRTLACFCNGDQSGFVKEMTTARSLAPIERIVENRAAMTHSYTVLPLLYADGRLGEKLRREERFRAMGTLRQANLVVRANTTHIMTKELMVDWIRTCLCNASGTPEIHLIVDSWSPFRDINTMEEAAPE